MNDELTFNTDKLSQTVETIRTNYLQYKDAIENLEKEINSLESIGNNSIPQEFKEKFEEKKRTLLDAENMMKELLDTLENKNEELSIAVTNTKNTFE